MTLTRWTIDDVAGALTWSRLRHFLTHLPSTSATKRELSGMPSAWLDGSLSAELLCQIFDILNMFRHEHAVSKIPKGKTRPNPPERHPRPEAARPMKEKSEPFDYEALRRILYQETKE